MSLTKKEVEKFKEQLEMLRGQLTQNLLNISENIKSNEDSKGYSHHQADEGTDDFDQRINVEVSSKERDLLRQVDRALKKIEEGTYGICDVSGEEISKKRLEAIPYAVMTVRAQEKLEKGIRE